jgi:hypothetical protein
MKRDELIKKLLELPPDAEITIDMGCGCCGYSEDSFEPVQYSGDDHYTLR